LGGEGVNEDGKSFKKKPRLKEILGVCAVWKSGDPTRLGKNTEEGTKENRKDNSGMGEGIGVQQTRQNLFDDQECMGLTVHINGTGSIH